MRIAPVLTAAALVCAGVAGWYWVQTPPAVKDAVQRPSRRGGGGGAPRDAPAPVVVATIGRETVAVTREGIGTVQSLAAVTVRSQVDGRLMSVEFVEGQTVKKGEVLARIDPTVYQAQYDQALAKKAQDEATLANARLDLQRYQRLAASNAGPKQQADSQAATVAQLEAQVKSDVAATDNARAVLAYTTITSPLDGRIGLRGIDPGNIVKAGDAAGLALITQMQPIAVVFTLPQRDLGVVTAALARGAVPVEAMEQEGRGVLSRGTLQTIDNQIDVSTGTIKLKATFANDDLKLWPGQFISTRVAVDTLVDAHVVPTPAVRRGPSGTFVYLVGPDSTVEVRPVKVVLQDETRAVIGEGVEAGQRVVTVGFAQLANGKQVTVSGEDGAQPVPAAGGPPTERDAVPGDRKRGGAGGERKRDGGDGKERRRRDEAGTTAKPG